MKKGNEFWLDNKENKLTVHPVNIRDVLIFTIFHKLIAS